MTRLVTVRRTASREIDNSTPNSCLFGQDRGVAEGVPGLYFVGLKCLHSALSDTLLVVGRDAGYVVDRIVERRPVAHTLSS